MNLLTKTTPWLVASILSATSAFAQQDKASRPPAKAIDQGHELSQTQMMAGYNAPARIDVRGSWDFYATGSFIYWQPRQENMELGINHNTTTSTDLINGNVLNMDFQYKPGFKVGLGMNFDHDNWDAYAVYTWLRGEHNHCCSTTTPNVLLAMWGHPSFHSAAENAFNSICEKWQLHMDLLDLELARSYYVGTKLSFRPFFGARAAWIRQRVSVNNVNTAFSNPIGGITPSLGTLFTTQKTHSWAVGPRAGLYSNWMLGEGFRLYGNGAGDILYTRYTKLRTHEVFRNNLGALVNTVRVRQSDLDYLRTHLELELGLGWGSYFDNNNWHVDLAAGYGFQVFFDQNMFRHFDENEKRASSRVPSGNLYVHGLTATVRFDF